MPDAGDNRDHLKGFRSRRTWVRGFFMLLFLVALWYVRLLLIFVAVFQFGAQLITRHPLQLLCPLGRSLGIYLKQIAMFLTFNTEDLPFPFSSWPDSGTSVSIAREEFKTGITESKRNPKENDALIQKWRRIFAHRHPTQQ